MRSRVDNTLPLTIANKGGRSFDRRRRVQLCDNFLLTIFSDERPVDVPERPQAIHLPTAHAAFAPTTLFTPALDSVCTRVTSVRALRTFFEQVVLKLLQQLRNIKL